MNKKKFRVLGEYVGHLLMGALMFLALLLFSGALNLFVHWFGPMIGDETFVSLMKAVERIILYTDVAFLVWWAIYSTYKAVKEMMK